jgi:tetratricopeptide (TPR) repeat protein
MEEGNRLYRAKDYKAAVATYSRALEFGARLPPRLSAEIYANRSIVFRLLKDIARAVADAEQACKAQPEWFRGHQRLAEAMEAQGRYVEAVPVYEQAHLSAASSLGPQHEITAKLRTSLEGVKVHAEQQTPQENVNAQGPRRGTFPTRSSVDPSTISQVLTALALDGGSGKQKWMKGYAAVQEGHAASEAGRYTEAVSQYTKAATQFSHPEGMYNLARMMYYGRGTARDVRGAERWARRATQQPDDLGDDIPKAFRLAGQGAGWNFLGRLAADGIPPFDMDPVKARECYEKSAACECPAGLDNLATFPRSRASKS